MRKSLVVGLALALLAAACASDDEAASDGDVDGGDTASATDDGGSSGDSSSDQDAGFAGEVTIGENERLQPADCEGENLASPEDGVSEDTINVAVLSIDFEPLAEIGFSASDRDPTEAFTTFVDEVNDNGGICGRTIDVQRVVFDILAGEGGQACVEATEDRNNLVISTQAYDEVLCLTDAGASVYAGNDVTEDELASAEGRLFTRYPLVEDQYLATAQHALDDGALDGKVGLWYGSVYQEQTDTVEEVVLPFLDENGVDYSDFRTGFVGPSDPEGNTVLRAAATGFAQNQVDTVLAFVQNTNHTGLQTELDAQGLSPRYISMPISANVANELFADRFGTRDIADGQEFVSFSLGATEVGPDDPISASCHEAWTERTGETVEPNTFDYAGIVTQCVQVDALVAALSLAGGELDRDRLQQAFESLPPFRQPPLIDEIAWTPDHHAGGTAFAVQTYDGASNTVTTSEDRFQVDR